jgi:quercetin dioxygenase-like cupin family protein
MFVEEPMRSVTCTLLASVSLLSSLAIAQQGQFHVNPLVERKVTELPAGELFWHVNAFDSVDQAEQAAGPLGLVAEFDGKAWLFTLGHADEAPEAGEQVATIGPLPAVTATEYLLRVNEAGGPQGSATAPHTHPGSESFYVIAGELSQKTPSGVMHLGAGESMVGHGGGEPMIVSNSGTGELKELALFVVDADKPFSSPAKLD